MSLCHSHDEKKLADLNAAAAVWASKPQSLTTRIPLPPISR